MEHIPCSRCGKWIGQFEFRVSIYGHKLEPLEHKIEFGEMNFCEDCWALVESMMKAQKDRPDEAYYVAKIKNLEEQLSRLRWVKSTLEGRKLLKAAGESND